MNYSPWGHVQQSEKLGDGIIRIYTSSHGGIKVDKIKNQKIPIYLREESGYYEEDCAWCIPAIFFPESFKKEQEEAKKTLKDWYWKEYEKHYNTVIPKGESFKKDQDTFLEENKDNWIVVCAWGDWHEKVPSGMVAVCTTKGGKRGQNVKEKHFILPEKDYKNRKPGQGFVVDTTKYEEVEAL